MKMDSLIALDRHGRQDRVTNLRAVADDGEAPVSCYLCAYQKTQTPETPEPLPATAPTTATDALGSCWKCSVWACSLHGTRYGQFTCAMCLYAAAAVSALTSGRGAPAPPDRGGDGGGIARSLVHLTGLAASESIRNQVQHALSRIGADHARLRRPGEPRPDLFDDAQPNLISDLPGGISRSQHPPDAVLPPVRGLSISEPASSGTRSEAVSIEAVGVQVRDTFAAIPELELDDASVLDVAGALILSLSLADTDTANEIAMRGFSELEASQLPAPWAVSHPVLIDPVMWLVATAFVSATLPA